MSDRLTPAYQTTFDHTQLMAELAHTGERRCRRVALGNGITREKAESCDDGSAGCPNCPWLSDRNTTFSELRPKEQFVILEGRLAGRLMMKLVGDLGTADEAAYAYDRRRGATIVDSQLAVRPCRSIS